MADISRIMLPNGSAYDFKDLSAQVSCALLANSKADISSVSKVFVKDAGVAEYSSGKQSDLSVIKLAASEYEQLVINGMTSPNALYIVSSDYINAYGEQLKNLAAATDLSDAVTLEQLQEVSSIALSGLSSGGDISSMLSSITLKCAVDNSISAMVNGADLSAVWPNCIMMHLGGNMSPFGYIDEMLSIDLSGLYHGWSDSYAAITSADIVYFPWAEQWLSAAGDELSDNVLATHQAIYDKAVGKGRTSYQTEQDDMQSGKCKPLFTAEAIDTWSSPQYPSTLATLYFGADMIRMEGSSGNALQTSIEPGYISLYRNDQYYGGNLQINPTGLTAYIDDSGYSRSAIFDGSGLTADNATITYLNMGESGQLVYQDSSTGSYNYINLQDLYNLTQALPYDQSLGDQRYPVQLNLYDTVEQSYVQTTASQMSALHSAYTARVDGDTLYLSACIASVV